MLNLTRAAEEAEQMRERVVDACDLCGGQGATVPDEDDIDPDTMEPRVVPCTCYLEAVRQVRLIEGNVPREFREEAEATFKAFAEGPNEVVAELLSEYVNRMEAARRHGLGFFFYGENGVGKTLCATWLLSQAVRKGLSVFYVTADEWLEGVRAGFRDEELVEWMRLQTEADLFVLDELGKEHRAAGSTFAPAEFDKLIRGRASALKPTVVVSNIQDRDQVREDLGSSLTSILSGRRFRWVEFEPGDFRGAVTWEELLNE